MFKQYLLTKTKIQTTVDQGRDWMKEFVDKDGTFILVRSN